VNLTIRFGRRASAAGERLQMSVDRPRLRCVARSAFSAGLDATW
jgi:hypothetical protein